MSLLSLFLTFCNTSFLKKLIHFFKFLKIYITDPKLLNSQSVINYKIVDNDFKSLISVNELMNYEHLIIVPSQIT